MQEQTRIFQANKSQRHDKDKTMRVKRDARKKSDNEVI